MTMRNTRMKPSAALLALLLASTALSAPNTDTAFKTRNVAILVYDEVELLDFAGPGEVLEKAAVADQKAFHVYTVAPASKEITSQQFLKVTADYSIKDCPVPDILVIPGGNSAAQATNEELIAWIEAMDQKAEYVLTVCNGVRLLAKPGERVERGQPLTEIHAKTDDDAVRAEAALMRAYSFAARAPRPRPLVIEVLRSRARRAPKSSRSPASPA